LDFFALRFIAVYLKHEYYDVFPSFRSPKLLVQAYDKSQALDSIKQQNLHVQNLQK